MSSTRRKEELKFVEILVLSRHRQHSVPLKKRGRKHLRSLSDELTLWEAGGGHFSGSLGLII